MKLLLHPVYFPNICTFAAMSRHPITWEVHDNYQKQTFRNRCHICTDQGRHLLTIPIKHVGGTSGRQLYREVRLDNNYQWQSLHWKTLQTAYRTSPFFEYYEEELAPMFESRHTFLLDFNFKAIELIGQCLKIRMSYETSAAFKLVTDIEDARWLVNAKIPHNMEQPGYIQVFGDRHGFVKNASILDLLFNVGTRSASYLESFPLPWTDA